MAFQIQVSDVDWLVPPEEVKAIVETALEAVPLMISNKTNSNPTTRTEGAEKGTIKVNAIGVGSLRPAAKAKDPSKLHAGNVTIELECVAIPSSEDDFDSVKKKVVDDLTAMNITVGGKSVTVVEVRRRTNDGKGVIKNEAARKEEEEKRNHSRNKLKSRRNRFEQEVVDLIERIRSNHREAQSSSASSSSPSSKRCGDLFAVDAHSLYDAVPLGAVPRVDWYEVPDAADPMRGGGLGAADDAASANAASKKKKKIIVGAAEDDEAKGEDTAEGRKTAIITAANSRAERKRLQVESFFHIMYALLAANPRASVGMEGTTRRIVDFGCGSGNLTIPLAYLLNKHLGTAASEPPPSSTTVTNTTSGCDMVGIDMKGSSIERLNTRAREAGFPLASSSSSAVDAAQCVGVTGRIEEFDMQTGQLTTITTDAQQQQQQQQNGSSSAVASRRSAEDAIDFSISLHACGCATDLTIAQALLNNVPFLVSPCCIGKLKFNPTTGEAEQEMFTAEDDGGDNEATAATSCCDECADAEVKKEQPPTDGAKNGEDWTEGVVGTSEAALMVSSRGLPRSDWLRKHFTPLEFSKIIKRADSDHSMAKVGGGVETVDDAAAAAATSPSHVQTASHCKTLVELDRCLFAAEVKGYRVAMLRLKGHEEVAKSHLLLGVPPSWKLLPPSSPLAVDKEEGSPSSSSVWLHDLLGESSIPHPQ